MNSNSVALESPERLPGETGTHTEREPIVIEADDAWMEPLAGETLAPGGRSRKPSPFAFMPKVNWDRFEPGARGRATALAAVVLAGLAAGGGAFLLQRHHQAQQAAAASGPAEVGVSPSVAVTGHAPAPPAPAQAAASKPAAIAPEGVVPPKLDQALADFASLKAPTGPGEVGVAPPPASPAAQPAPPASPPTPAPAPVAEVHVLASAPPAASPDAAKAAAEVKAAPLSQAQQIELIGLVKELGAQLHDTRTQVTDLFDAVAQLSKQVETRTNDFEVRLGLAEATTALSASARAGSPAPAGTTLSVAAVVPGRPPGGRAAATVPVPPPPAPERRTVKDYVVKGASPGLAVLSAPNPVTGAPSVIEVAVGDQVPGVGKVKSISQRGATWIVQTENGPIQP
jgi:hypothetical protein